MNRRTFLHVVGTSSLLALVPVSPVMSTNRARRDRDRAPLPGLSRCGHYWSEERRALLHVPWFVAMRHACDA